jgi:chromosome segregation ATPase
VTLGIFGFLTSAYQQSHVKIEMLNAQKNGLESEKQIIQIELDNLTKRIETLNQIRIMQEQRVQNAGNYKLPREQAYEAINKANLEIEQSKDKINELSLNIKTVNEELLSLKLEESKSKDIGTLKFVAQFFVGTCL